MKKYLVSTAMAGALLLGATAAQAEGELRIYHWFDYISQELLDKFSEEYGVDVIIDTYDSNESLLAALKAGKLGEYDVAVPGDYMVKIMTGEGMLDTFEPSELPNFGNIDEQWVNVDFDEGRKSSIPYQIGTTGFMVNREAYDGDIGSLSILFDPPEELQGNINVFDSQGELLALASMYLGIPQCSSNRDQLKALNDQLLASKEHWASFGSDIAKEVLVSGDAKVGMMYNGFGLRARSENAALEYAYPKEGYVFWMDNVVLLKDAPNRENALKFMNFLLEPENAAEVSNFAGYISGVTGAMALAQDDVKNAPELNPPAGQTGQFVQSCEQSVQELYDRIWTNVKK
ncbi:extracellular solute-binding protein [uncultured Ruegeria sp.]|uniref:extracellular solute-binding protein n=1 Tax=uncultured Ruegeria sp. TaxID=259304 RepID=UPI00261A2B26|nr:extracellular solute-binding protein [uncultured Ruegeria sp.]